MFKDFKPVLKILLRFLVLYLVLVFLYQLYLNQTRGVSLDRFSYVIAEQVQEIQNKIGYPTKLYHDGKVETVRYYVKDTYVTRMVEGCNAVSVLILFISFLFAFYGGKKTFVFAFFGLVFIYVVNLVRIVALNIIMYDAPAKGLMFHDYIFPAIIYGSVVFLWLIWIRGFALKKERNA